MIKAKLTNWSNYPIVSRHIFTPKDKNDLISHFSSFDVCIARGNGRSYGDCSYSKNVIQTNQMNRIISFDAVKGVIRCESGVILDDILQLIVPKGYFLPVTPGTKLISIGGAVASDIHGKNHHIDGNFSNYVETIELLNKDGELVQLKKTDELFLQTIGGMGLTGIILEVEFRLKKIETSFLKVKHIKSNNLNEIIDLMIQNKDFTYSVAWIDCLAKGNKLGRSVLMLGEHASWNELSQKQQQFPLQVHQKAKFKLPIYFPKWFLSKLFIKTFNQTYYFISSRKKETIVHYDPYFYPLDSVADWNKVYGKNGFIEYQFVIPLNNAQAGIGEILSIISHYGLASFLCVIKLFGNNTPNRYLNFPFEGITLGMDLKMNNQIWQILDQLDTIVSKFGGRVYLTKDSRLKAEMFKKQYKELIPMTTKFQSDQSVRLEQKSLNTYLILGANSDIAKSYINHVSKVESDAYFILCSQNTKALDQFILNPNLSNRSEVLYLNLLDDTNFVDFIQKLKIKPSTILYAAGVCPENDSVYNDVELIEIMTKVNYTSAVKLLNLLTIEYNPRLRKIIGISSIAGVRGRKSNFMYGSTKAAFHQYLFGLRQRLREDNICVQSVTPGAVKTKMTSHLKLPFFASSPDQVAIKIYKTSRKFQIYPSILWKIISIIVQIAPEKIVSKLK